MNTEEDPNIKLSCVIALAFIAMIAIRIIADLVK